MRRAVVALAALVICPLPLVVRADWDPCNPDPNTKFCQLPDPGGWDVKVTPLVVPADDFVCVETGWITDIRFWGSWKGGVVGEIESILLHIRADIPAGEIPYSRPGKPLWATEIIPDRVPPGSVQIQDEVSGPQGWYDPDSGEYTEYDHSGMVQVNIFLDQIFPREELFIQEGSPANPVIYWLDIQVNVDDWGIIQFGWKTSMDHLGPGDAVWFRGYYHICSNQSTGPQPLLDPVTGEGLDMAFVITGIPIPEPGIMVLSGLGLLALLARRRRK